MRYLLDTCVISELQRPAPNSGVSQFMTDVDDTNLFLSVITLGEITKGIALLRNGKRKLGLTQWASGIEQYYASRILPIDSDTAYIWGELTATAQKQGYMLPMADGLIAASARRHGLHVVTRNTRDFVHTGVMLHDPWTPT